MTLLHDAAMDGKAMTMACRYCGATIAAESRDCPACRRAFTETCSLCKGKFDKDKGVSCQKLFFCRNCLINDKERAIRKTSYELRRNVFYARFIVNRLRREILAKEEGRTDDG